MIAFKPRKLVWEEYPREMNYLRAAAYTLLGEYRVYNLAALGGGPELFEAKFRPEDREKDTELLGSDFASEEAARAACQADNDDRLIRECLDPVDCLSREEAMQIGIEAALKAATAIYLGRQHLVEEIFCVAFGVSPESKPEEEGL